MIYEIESKNDLSGAMLVIRFPETDLDTKALYTIENEQPPFLIPFSHRSVDGMSECTYRLGNLTKLQYQFGTRSPAEYVEFWNRVLQPLLDCDDWFLKPFSFVLDSRQIYSDKEGTVKYLYVPSLVDCEEFEALHNLAMRLSQENRVSNAELENKVLRAMMQDFQPKSFLEMLRKETPVAEVVEMPAAPVEKKLNLHLPENLMPKMEMPVEQAKPETPAEVHEPTPVPFSQDLDDGDIHINFGGEKKPLKEKPAKERKPLFGSRKEKAEKPVKERKPLFGGKKEKNVKVVLGAGAEQPPERPFFEVPHQAQSCEPHVYYDTEGEDGATMLLDNETEGCCLKLVGQPGMPREIQVNIERGSAFTIGRFDVTVGHKQCDFEFEKNTRAVTRRHAAIERDENDQYSIVDLASSAGTFVDGVRLVPNVPHQITNGCRICFGTGGADYIWNE